MALKNAAARVMPRPKGGHLPESRCELLVSLDWIAAGRLPPKRPELV